MHRQHPSSAADPLTASAPARRRSTRQWGPGGGMRRKLTQPNRGDRGRREHPGAESTSGSASTADRARWIEHRHRRGRQLGTGRTGRRQPDSRSPSACAPTACPTSQTQTPAEDSCFHASAGINPSSPAFKAAQAKCEKLLPGGGPPGPGSATHPSAQTLAKLRQDRAMHAPARRSPSSPTRGPPSPSNLAGITEITDFDGAILLFPATFNLQAPAYKQALAACGAPPLGLPH